jgi:hypothetical protein
MQWRVHIVYVYGHSFASRCAPVLHSAPLYNVCVCVCVVHRRLRVQVAREICISLTNFLFCTYASSLTHHFLFVFSGLLLLFLWLIQSYCLYSPSHPIITDTRGSAQGILSSASLLLRHCHHIDILCYIGCHISTIKDQATISHWSIRWPLVHVLCGLTLCK